jgi:hypothetical protein
VDCLKILAAFGAYLGLYRDIFALALKQGHQQNFKNAGATPRYMKPTARTVSTT